MGFVYKVRQPSQDRTVALKILSPALGRDPAFAERFAREARVLGKLNHPNIVTVFEHGESGGFLYLLMEFVDGVNQRQAMRAGRFTPPQARAVVPGICDALGNAAYMERRTPFSPACSRAESVRRSGSAGAFAATCSAL